MLERAGSSLGGRLPIRGQQSSSSHLPNRADSSHSWPGNNSVTQEIWSFAKALLQQPAGGWVTGGEMSGQLAFVTKPSLSKEAYNKFPRHDIRQCFK